MKNYLKEKIRCSDQRLTAGAGLVLQKGLKLVLPQSAKLSFKRALVMSSATSSGRSLRLCLRGSSFRPVYSHIKPGRRLKGITCHEIQTRTRSIPLRPLPRRALILLMVGDQRLTLSLR